MKKHVHNDKAAFHWNDGTPSIFSRDPGAIVTKSGKGTQQLAIESVRRREAANGVNPGTIRNLSRKGDAGLKRRAA